MQDKKLGRNPFESKISLNVPSAKSQTTLFKQVIKPVSDLEKIKEMQIQVDWTELYQSITKNISKLFLVFSFFYLGGCALGGSVKEVELKKQVIELQKLQAKQSNIIDELNNKIYLLSDRVEHFERKNISTPQQIIQQQRMPESLKSGDVQLYEMAMKDLKSNSMPAYEKKVEFLVKGFKKSPLTDNALFLLGQAHFNQKKYTEASQAFEKLYSLSPDGSRAVSALYMLGLSYQKQGRLQEAKEAYQTIINIYPGSQEASESNLKIAALNRGKK
jgi:TolA-binding protein